MPCYWGQRNRSGSSLPEGDRHVTQLRQDRRAIRAARRLGAPVLLMLGALAASPAAAQFSDSYKFLEAVRKSDNAKILEFLEQPGVTLVNTRDRTSGETALLIAVGRRDMVMVNYLLSRGARTDLTDNAGKSPLMLAVERRFVEGAQALLAKKANTNQANNSGETPLIRAVQIRDLEMVRLLLANGADPDRRDTLAGMSAIDYAKAGAPVSGMMDALTAKRTAPRNKAVQGPTL
jgi:ankyrin repeat protein